MMTSQAAIEHCCLCMAHVLSFVSSGHGVLPALPSAVKQTFGSKKCTASKCKNCCSDEFCCYHRKKEASASQQEPTPLVQSSAPPSKASGKERGSIEEGKTSQTPKRKRKFSIDDADDDKPTQAQEIKDAAVGTKEKAEEDPTAAGRHDDSDDNSGISTGKKKEKSCVFPTWIPLNLQNQEAFEEFLDRNYNSAIRNQQLERDINVLKAENQTLTMLTDKDKVIEMDETIRDMMIFTSNLQDEFKKNRARVAELEHELARLKPKKSPPILQPPRSSPRRYVVAGGTVDGGNAGGGNAAGAGGDVVRNRIDDSSTSFFVNSRTLMGCADPPSKV